MRHKMPLNIEIKDQRRTRFDQHVASLVLDAVHRAGSASMVLISSFNHDYLVQCKALAPHISIGVLQNEQHPPELVQYLQTIGAAAYHPADAITSRELIRTLRAAGSGQCLYGERQTTATGALRLRGHRHLHRFSGAACPLIGPRSAPDPACGGDTVFPIFRCEIGGDFIIVSSSLHAGSSKSAAGPAAAPRPPPWPAECDGGQWPDAAWSPFFFIAMFSQCPGHRCRASNS